MDKEKINDIDDGNNNNNDIIINDAFANDANANANANDEKLKRGTWTEEEDKILRNYVTKFGEGNWNMVSKNTRLLRSGKCCRLRWMNHLNPNLKRGKFTQEEIDIILYLHYRIKNKWSEIAKHVPGRTDNEIKNFINTRIRKFARLNQDIYPDYIKEGATNTNGKDNGSNGNGKKTMLMGSSSQQVDTSQEDQSIPEIRFKNIDYEIFSSIYDELGGDNNDEILYEFPTLLKNSYFDGNTSLQINDDIPSTMQHNNMEITSQNNDTIHSNMQHNNMGNTSQINDAMMTIENIGTSLMHIPQPELPPHSNMLQNNNGFTFQSNDTNIPRDGIETSLTHVSQPELPPHSNMLQNNTGFIFQSNNTIIPIPRGDIETSNMLQNNMGITSQSNNIIHSNMLHNNMEIPFQSNDTIIPRADTETSLLPHPNMLQNNMGSTSQNNNTTIQMGVIQTPLMASDIAPEQELPQLSNMEENNMEINFESNDISFSLEELEMMGITVESFSEPPPNFFDGLEFPH